LREEYEQGWQVTEFFPANVLGFQSHRDHFAIAYEKAEIEYRVKDMLDKSISDQDLRKKYDIRDNRDWHIPEARTLLRSAGNPTPNIIPCSYRPFDKRWCFFGYETMDYPRRELMSHVARRKNLCLNVVRQTRASEWKHVLMSDDPTPAVFIEIKDGSSVFPLYLYAPPEREKIKDDLFEEDDPFQGKERIENFSPQFRAFVDEKYKQHYSPEGILGYIYAVLHSPTYRRKYRNFLKIDFPRVPFVNQRETFEALSTLGWELVQVHLLKSIPSGLSVEPTPGDFVVEKPAYDTRHERLHINTAQYFSSVPQDVWEFHIGGYQVLNQYLKSRKGHTLSLDEIENIQNVVNVLRFTIDQMQRIEACWHP